MTSLTWLMAVMVTLQMAPEPGGSGEIEVAVMEVNSQGEEVPVPDQDISVVALDGSNTRFSLRTGPSGAASFPSAHGGSSGFVAVTQRDGAAKKPSGDSRNLVICI